ncbi:hypothetical protein ZOSMA_140G00150 [Zostera marina]|uniref:Peroxisomal membrane 22 kDa (Mpv17/PMP22) family protein n=1 Tax=Zostera marina TaxID=29655 RepID=A0A0K9PZW1_ZOSMR|nr:hypothetical protein ZOSMA_140G00150 [Zostera marina]
MEPHFFKPSLISPKSPVLTAHIGLFPTRTSCSPPQSLFNSTAKSGYVPLRLGFHKGKPFIGLLRCGVIVGSNGNDGNSGSRGAGGGGDDSGAHDGSLFSWYLKSLQKHPIFTKSLTSALLNLVGDLICQLLINQVSTIDVNRLAVITFLGFALVGPALHYWYYSLSKIVKISGTNGTFLRLLLDQFLFSPTFIAVFMSSLVTLEGKPSLVIPKLKQEWVSAVIANWQLWIPFQFLNFQFVPQPFQVLAANIVAIAWNVILSFMAHKEIILK